MKKIALISCFIFLLLNNKTNAQTTISTVVNSSGYTGIGNFFGNSFITFNVENTNPYPIFLNDVELHRGSIYPLDPSKFTLWYSKTSLSGDMIISKPTWDSVTTITGTGLVSGSLNKIFTDLAFVIPANTQYRFAVQSTNGIAFSGNFSGACSPSQFTAAGVNLNVGQDTVNGDVCGVVGQFPGGQYQTIFPRWFTGSITFLQALACTGTPVAGTAVASVVDGCYGVPFNLSVPNATLALNLKYQWDSSTNGTTWIPMIGDTTRSITQSQTVTSQYRCRVSCGASSVASAPTQVTTPTPVSGNFTINAAQVTGGTNFSSFTDAVNYIKCGINGPVKFTVVQSSGPYDEQVVIPQIAGASATNTVIFKGNNETLSSTHTTQGNRTILILDGADYVTLDSLVIDATQGTYAWGMALTNGADNNTITNCTINSNALSSSINYIGLAINGNAISTNTSGTNGSNNKIVNNTISGGYFSIYAMGDNSNPLLNTNNIIKNNKLIDMYASAVYITNHANTIIEGNDISRPNRSNSSSGFTGITCGSKTLGMLVQNNKIHDIFAGIVNSSAGFTGISIGGSGKLNYENRVQNNVIWNIKSGGAFYGLFNLSADTTYFYHNTVVFDDNLATAGYTSMMYMTGNPSGAAIRNNIFWLSRSGTSTKRMININSALATNITLNNNAYYFAPTPSANVAFGQIGGLTFVTYADWQTTNGNGYDVQSKEADPLFADLANGDLTPTEAAINDYGVNVGVQKDISGNIRGASPDPGAYEFTTTPCSTPVAAGTVSVTNNVCAGADLALSLTNNSYGAGQTYLWQKSLTGTGGWSNVQNALTNPNIITTQNVNYYYRCKVKCNNDSAYTTAELVTTPSLLSGTFTINAGAASGGGNFNTIQEAIDYISCGISGPVILNIAPNSGPYLEQVIVPAIKGTSNTNTIKLNGHGNSLNPTITNANKRVAFHLKGVDHFIIDSLDVDVSASATMGWAYLLNNQADSNVIKNCNITLHPTITNSNFYGIIMTALNTNQYSPGNNGSYNQFISNTINGGTAAFWLYGNNSSNIQNNNNIIKNNKILDFNTYAVYTSSQSNGLTVSGNDISRPNRPNGSFGYGVYSSGSLENDVLIEKNRIHNVFDQIQNGASSFTGIYVSAKAKQGHENKIVNNLIYNLNNNGFHVGINIGSSDSTQVYHNTIVMDDQATTTGNTWGISQGSQALGVNIMNNISYITRSGTGNKRHFVFSSATSKINCNNNVIYGTVTNIGTWGNTNYTTLNNWQNGTGFDLQTQEFDPAFTVTGGGANYLPNNPSINGIGANVGVTTDILGVARTTSPDPGAFEVNITACANPPIAGASVVSNANVCPNSSFTLNLNGNTVGTGQTYWWERSPTINGTYSTVGLATITPTITANQTATNYYRCKVQCSGGTNVYSTPVLVSTPNSVSGNFTIDNNSPSTSTNFKSFTEAFNYIACGGMGGPININVVPGSGPYNEKIYIPQIGGSSAINTLKIYGNGALLNFVSNDINNKVGVTLDGADYVTIDSLNIDVSKGQYGWGLLLTNMADNNTIRKCNITTNADVTNTNWMGILINGSNNTANTSGDNGMNNLIEMNTIVGGYNGIALYGNTGGTSGNDDNKIINNTIQDFYANGVLANYMKMNLLVSKNDISRPLRTSSTNGGGVYINLGCNNVLVEKNRIHGTFDAMPNNASTFNGIYMGSKTKSTTPNRVFNNAVYDINSNGNTYGIFNASADSMQAYHNTIVFDNVIGTGSANIIGFYQNGLATGIDFKNNVIAITRSSLGIKRCLLFATNGSTIASNRNILYLNSSGSNNGIGGWVANIYQTLANWQTANGGIWDAASKDINPMFKAATTGDFIITEPLCRNVGLPIGGITKDIIDITRSTTTPDAGAFEYYTILPVKSLNFTGKNNGTYNILSWTTIAEENNKVFELQKSNNGTDFETIAFINTKAQNGNSTSLLEYSFNDMQPKAGNNYYRLKQIDVNGAYTYSKVVLLQLATKYNVQVYPNPAHNVINIKVDKLMGVGTIVVTDIYGKQIYQSTVNKQVSTVNCSNFAKGIYFVSVVTEQGKQTQKVIVE